MEANWEAGLPRVVLSSPGSREGGIPVSLDADGLCLRPLIMLKTFREYSDRGWEDESNGTESTDVES